MEVGASEAKSFGLSVSQDSTDLKSIYYTSLVLMVTSQNPGTWGIADYNAVAGTTF